MVAAIILAAGGSTRMGQSKPLLAYSAVAGETFVSKLVENVKLSGFSVVLVVGRPGDALLAAEVARCSATYVENPRPEQGQLSSLQTALAALEDRFGPELEAVMVMPVDAPLISSAAVNLIVKAARVSTAQILRATHDGQHGHPVLFKRSTFFELQNADPDVGARVVVRADPSRLEDVDVGEKGVTIDFDTPEQYRRHFGTAPSTSR
ncbi:MAG: nucleotidyltransferase family protein [Acidobacteriota bacterium]|nr:nucleotidyltransferase family protein [Acidobacteriota bacterium]MDQ3418649.1 nucleotidyltransferase family protein [Acidobacteriota bacterium]